MITLLATSPFLVALIGVALGYFFKRVVLLLLTTLVGILMFWAIGALMNPTHSLADILPAAVIIQGIVLLVPMWITHFVKHVGGLKACLERLKSATLDE